MHAWDKQQSIKSMTVFNSYKCSKSQSLLSSTPVSLWIKAGGKMNQTLLSSALTGSHGAGWASRGPLREASSHPCKHHQPGPAVGGAGSRRGSRVLAGSLKHIVTTSRLYTLLLSQWSWVVLIWMFCLQLLPPPLTLLLLLLGGFWKSNNKLV